MILGNPRSLIKTRTKIQGSVIQGGGVTEKQKDQQTNTSRNTDNRTCIQKTQEDQATETQETKKQGYRMQEYKSWKTHTKAKN